MPHRPIFKATRDIRAFFVLSHDHREKYLFEPNRWFTRHSPLLFSRTAMLVFGLLRNSMSIELFDFFERLDINSVTKSAFCQRRQLIKHAFFRDLFILTADTFYKRFKINRWKGFRFLAVDGTGFRLPAAENVGKTFGWHGNQYNRVPSMRALLGYDVMNKIIYNVVFTQR